MGFDKHRVRIGLGHGLLRLPPDLADLLKTPITRLPANERRVPDNTGIADGEIGHAVDVVTSGRVAQEIVQECPEPGIPGFRIGREPDDLAHLAIPVPSAIQRRIAESLHGWAMRVDDALNLSFG